MAMPVNLRSVVLALWMIFAGALLSVITVRIGGRDLLNDVLGQAMMLAGVAWVCWNLRAGDRPGFLVLPCLASLAGLGWAVLSQFGCAPRFFLLCAAVAMIEVGGGMLLCLVLARGCERSEMIVAPMLWRQTFRILALCGFAPLIVLAILQAVKFAPFPFEYRYPLPGSSTGFALMFIMGLVNLIAAQQVYRAIRRTRKEAWDLRLW